VDLDWILGGHYSSCSVRRHPTQLGLWFVYPRGYSGLWNSKLPFWLHTMHALEMSSLWKAISFGRPGDC